MARISRVLRLGSDLLLQHPWRGNVHHSHRRFHRLSDLPEHLQHRSPRLPGDDEWQPRSLDEVRKAHIQKVLRMRNGNRLRGAPILGIGRTSLYRYLKRDGYETRPHSNGVAA